MDLIQKFEKDKIISFSSRKKLIHFVSKYLAHQYRQCLEFWRATSGENPETIEFWNYRIKVEVPKLKKAIKELLIEKTNRKKRFSFTYKSSLLQRAFYDAGILEYPNEFYPIHFEYKINTKKLVFKIRVKR